MTVVQTMAGAWREACSFDALQESVPTQVMVAGEPLVLVRRGEAVHAVGALCPHKYAPLEDGHVEGDELVCSQHDAGFRLGTGEPRPGCTWAGNLEIHETRVRDGMIQVRLL